MYLDSKKEKRRKVKPLVVNGPSLNSIFLSRRESGSGELKIRACRLHSPICGQTTSNVVRKIPSMGELMGEDNLLFASDMPHPEMRDNAAEEILDNKELSDTQKRKILYDNVVRYYGEP